MVVLGTGRVVNGGAGRDFERWEREREREKKKKLKKRESVSAGKRKSKEGEASFWSRGLVQTAGQAARVSNHSLNCLNDQQHFWGC